MEILLKANDQKEICIVKIKPKLDDKLKNITVHLGIKL
jgi:hypothetical protein